MYLNTKVILPPPPLYSTLKRIVGICVAIPTWNRNEDAIIKNRTTLVTITNPLNLKITTKLTERLSQNFKQPQYFRPFKKFHGPISILTTHPNSSKPISPIHSRPLPAELPTSWRQKSLPAIQSKIHGQFSKRSHGHRFHSKVPPLPPGF